MFIELKDLHNDAIRVIKQMAEMVVVKRKKINKQLTDILHSINPPVSF
jgi:hypothetical protein